MHKLLTLFISISLLLSSGCGFKDIDERSFVVVIGVDQGKTHKYEVTLKMVIPSPDIEPGKSKFQLLSREADSISSALQSLSSDADKQLDMGHAKIIIFSRAIGEENITEALNGFIRRSDIQRIEYIILGEPSAKAILALSPKSERVAANSMFLLLEHGGTESPYVITEYLYDFYQRLLERGKDPFLPIMTIREEMFEINRVALFNKTKVIMTLSKEQTGVLNQLLRNQTNFDIVVSEGGMKYSLLVSDFHYNYQIKAGISPQINLKFTLKATVEESNQPLFDKDWTAIEEKAAEQMKMKYVTLLEDMRKNKLDPLGFGLRYMAVHHQPEKDWEQWIQIYPKVKFNAEVEVILKGTGAIK